MYFKKLAAILIFITFLSGCSILKPAETKVDNKSEAAAFVDKLREEESRKLQEEKEKQELEVKRKAEAEAKLKAKQEEKLKAEQKAKGEEQAKIKAQQQAAKTAAKASTVQPKPASPSPTPSPSLKHPVEYVASIENEILKLVNQERAKAGLKPLAMEDTLRSMARYKSNDMLQNEYFDHISPKIGGLKELAGKFNYKYTALGENIWMSQSSSYSYLRQNTTAEKIMNGWMNSPGHRANILKDSFGRIGVGVTASTDGLIHATQEFSN